LGIISLTCSSCGVRLKAAEHMIGRHAPCPECGKMVLVRREDEADSSGADPGAVATGSNGTDGPRIWATIAGVPVTTGRLVVVVAAIVIALAAVGWWGMAR